MLIAELICYYCFVSCAIFAAIFFIIIYPYPTSAAIVFSYYLNSNFVVFAQIVFQSRAVKSTNHLLFVNGLNMNKRKRDLCSLLSSCTTQRIRVCVLRQRLYSHQLYVREINKCSFFYFT